MAANLAAYRAQLSGQTAILGVVKADAYGLGALAVARKLSQGGVNYFGVAALREVEELRQGGLTAPLLLLSQPDPQYAAKIVELGATATVYESAFAEQLSRAAPGGIKIHVKVDTGMNRIGLPPGELAGFLRGLEKYKNLEVEGLFTHLACLGAAGRKQLAEFADCVSAAKKIIPNLKYVHALSSLAVGEFPEAQYDMVRLGIGLYRGVLALKSRVMLVKTIQPGEAVSYGATFVADKPLRIATISAGYADGLSRLLSNRGRVLLNGRSYKLCGQICMDMCLAVVDDTVAVGNEVVLIGAQGGQEITAQELADLTDTIDYEIICGISKRVPRFYLE
ncbi:alanine racemase [Candidatus Termititenax persephonae]|uniref:Alanine racemase n=1 Tax=Candidatus Termititenax persephonae TaxID=2218525 RepID=A0A388TH39_9BACT|nr:alanine racemase [Candidatus Termititenax persephonae]